MPLVYAGTGSPALTAGLAAGGFLIDVDHVVDYLLFERQRDLRPSSFLRYYVNGLARRNVLVLHSYELLAALGAIAWITGIEWLWGWVFGMLLHLPLDVVFNGKFASAGLVHFYSFIVRARAGFRADNGLNIYAWVRNAFDQDYFEQLNFGPSNTGLIAGNLGDPRTWGGTIRFEF